MSQDRRNIWRDEINPLNIKNSGQNEQKVNVNIRDRDDGLKRVQTFKIQLDSDTYIQHNNMKDGNPHKIHFERNAIPFYHLKSTVLQILERKGDPFICVGFVNSVQPPEFHEDVDVLYFTQQGKELVHTSLSDK